MRGVTVLGVIFVLACHQVGGRPACAADLSALTQAAEAGNAEAALSLGTTYDIGDGVAANPQAALHWYEVAAEQGNVAAMFNVGAMYDTGTGTERDRAMAAKWYQRAAQHGHARAAYDLALLCERGEGVRRNLPGAMHWYDVAARSGLTAGRMKLAALTPMLHSAPMDADYARAQEMIEKQGLAAADPQMLELLKRAAGHGTKVAQYNLGYLYENGLGVEADPLEAYVWYRRAARQGGGTDATVARAANEGASRLAAKLDAVQQTAAAHALSTAQR